MPEATLTIRTVKSLKSGEANGRPWTLFEIQADGGQRFTTFDPAWRDHVGETVTATYEETQNGRYTNRVLGEFPKTARTIVPPHAPAPATGPDKFSMLTEKLDRILAEVVAIRRHFAA